MSLSMNIPYSTAKRVICGRTLTNYKRVGIVSHIKVKHTHNTQNQNISTSSLSSNYIPNRSFSSYNNNRRNDVEFTSENYNEEEEEVFDINKLNELEFDENLENIFVSNNANEIDDIKINNVRRRADLGEMSFADLGVNPGIIGKLSKANIHNPSAIQKLAVGHLIRRYDIRTNKLYVPPTVAIQDYTGSGKTLAYGLPMLSNINSNIDEKVLQPHIVGMLHKLRGIPLPSPPADLMEATWADEYERPRIIMYGKDDVFYGKDGGVLDDDVELESWVFDDHIHDSNMTEQQWEEYVLKRVEQAEFQEQNDIPFDGEEGASRQPKNLRERLFHNKKLDPSFTLEAQRLRRKAKLMAKLKEIFPTLNDDQLDSDAPQSRLQAIIVTPTKELAQQITNTLQEINPTMYTIGSADAGTTQVGEKKHVGVKKTKEGLIIRMVSGKVTSNMVKSLGLSVNPKIDENIATSYHNYATPKEDEIQRKVHGSTPAPALHPFVTFGKNHPLYRRDQDDIRARVVDSERDQALRRIRDRERGLELEKLEKIQKNDNEKRRLGLEDEDDRDSLYNNTNVDNDEDYLSYANQANPGNLPMKINNKKHKMIDGMPVVTDNRLMGQRLSGKDYRNHMNRLALEKELEEKKSKKDVVDQYKLTPSELLYEQLGADPEDTIEMNRFKQPHIVVGTPSTITELIRSGAIQLPSTGPSPSQLKYIVFDEIDHLARNDTSPEHRSVLELMGLPTDQSVFVSASMTRETALFMTRLSRRQTLPHLNLNPKHQSYTAMLNIPRPQAKQLTDEQIEVSFEEAEKYAQYKWEDYVAKHKLQGLPPVLNKKGEVVQVDEKTQMNKVYNKIMSKCGTPYLPSEIAVDMPFKATWNNLPISMDASSVGEVTFLTPDDYRDHASDSTNAMPLAPYLKHYYIKVPKGSSKYRTLLDIICQLKVKARKGMNTTMAGAKTSTADLSETTGSKTKTRNKAPTADKDDIFLDSNNGDLSTLLTGSASQVESVMENDINSTPSRDASIPSGDVVVHKSANSKDVCPGNILVFYSKKNATKIKNITNMINAVDLRAGMFNELSTRQEKRDVLYNSRSLDVIISNETLSRGIDISDLSLVINLDVPRSTSTYLHRAGRVGRLGSRFRKRSIVLNIIEDEENAEEEKFKFNMPFRGASSNQDDETLLSKHIEKLDIPMKPWPYKVPLNIHKQLMKSFNDVRNSEFRHENIRRKIQGKIGNNSKKKFHVNEESGNIFPTRTTRVRDDSNRANRSSRGTSLADSNQWVSWDSNSNAWKR